VKNNVEKTKSTLIKDAIALFLITLISGLALSFVYEITKAPIEQQDVVKKQKADKAVFMEASSFAEDKELMKLAKTTDLQTLSPDYEGVTINEISQALDGSNQLIGYDITVTTTTGYKDPITIVIGYSTDGVIKGVQITSINETAGLGMKAKEPAFINQYLNKKVSQFEVTKTGASSDEEIDAISGATITSRAVTNAINAGIGFVTNKTSKTGGGSLE
jgi:Predicted NADH:ubiquinone oxidoreductase, subunit RnfG